MNDKLHKINHSCEHIFNQAVEELYPGKIVRAMGPAIENGWYNDSRWEVELSENDFAKIEKRMAEIIKADLPFVYKEISKEEALKMFKHNPFKLEFIEEFTKNGEKLSVYYTGDPEAEKLEVPPLNPLPGGENLPGAAVFVDLCKGPHVERTSEIKAFKLLSIAGAYWRGDEKNEMLTRVYGTAWDSKENLEEYLHNIEEAKKRDHRKIAREMDLYTLSDLVGSGLPLYTPRGALVRRLLTNFVEDLQSKENYMQVWTPQIAKAELFKKSGHYDKYHEDMFRVVSNYSDEEFYLKPMNCPQHTQIYSSQMRSYRDLPIRMTDFAMLYRDEKPGELSGLARVRSFSQDDCHIFCREDQVNEEIDKALQMTKRIMEAFGFNYRYRLSTRDPQNPDKYLGDPKIWDKVEKWAVEIMERNDIEYYDGPGEAAFYAPKMDLMATDALGREWQLSTVQIDYVMPERFDLKFTNSEGKDERPVMIHRAIMGSAERFMMIIIEHFAGAFPVWLHPDQVAIIPVSEKHNEYAEKVKAQITESLQSARVKIFNNDERLQKKIREAQVEKIPYMLIVGDKEVEAVQVNVRLRTQEQLGAVSVGEFAKRLKEKVDGKALDL